jgi:hypothetical protein
VSAKVVPRESAAQCKPAATKFLHSDIIYDKIPGNRTQA